MKKLTSTILIGLLSQAATAQPTGEELLRVNDVTINGEQVSLPVTLSKEGVVCLSYVSEYHVEKSPNSLNASDYTVEMVCTDAELVNGDYYPEGMRNFTWNTSGDGGVHTFELLNVYP